MALIPSDIRNVVLLGFSFFILFSAFMTTQNIETSINKSSGELSLAVLYYVFAISNLMLSSRLVAILSERIALALAASLYAIYIAANLLVTVAPWMLIIGGAVNGVGAAVLWTAQGSFVSLWSRPSTAARNVGIFFAIFQLSQVVGNIVAWGILEAGSGHHTRTIAAPHATGAGTRTTSSSASVFGTTAGASATTLHSLHGLAVCHKDGSTAEALRRAHNHNVTHLAASGAVVVPAPGKNMPHMLGAPEGDSSLHARSFALFVAFTAFAVVAAIVNICLRAPRPGELQELEMAESAKAKQRAAVGLAASNRPDAGADGGQEAAGYPDAVPAMEDAMGPSARPSSAPFGVSGSDGAAEAAGVDTTDGETRVVAVGGPSECFTAVAHGLLDVARANWSDACLLLMNPIFLYIGVSEAWMFSVFTTHAAAAFSRRGGAALAGDALTNTFGVGRLCLLMSTLGAAEVAGSYLCGIALRVVRPRVLVPAGLTCFGGSLALVWWLCSAPQALDFVAWPHNPRGGGPGRVGGIAAVGLGLQDAFWNVATNTTLTKRFGNSRFRPAAFATLRFTNSLGVAGIFQYGFHPRNLHTEIFALCALALVAALCYLPVSWSAERCDETSAFFDGVSSAAADADAADFDSAPADAVGYGDEVDASGEVERTPLVGRRLQ
eukprot:TRINITY_DN907_c0_g3_i1.p1 TRINITY_DN907_c0_g3~~TRINITY_DN907_c0_g3_i1.p1  ORF type:complete len:665 (+),score=144.21 TRINITY_DN907_c0_g3_i1:186-2180(+)